MQKNSYVSAIKARGLKKSFKPPRIKKLGSVQQLTLKVGSNTDGMNGHLE